MWTGTALVWSLVVALSSANPFPVIVPRWLGVAVFAGLFGGFWLGCRWLEMGREREGLAVVCLTLGYLALSSLWASAALGAYRSFVVQPVLLAVLAAVPIVLWRREPKTRWVAASVVVVGLILMGLVGTGDTVARARVASQESSMNRDVLAVVEQATSGDEAVMNGFFDLCDRQGTTRIGPFLAQGCPQVREGRQGPEVWYTTTSGGNGFGVVDSGILFAKGGPASTDDPQLLSGGVCLNHLAGSWWEWYAPRESEPCPRGMRRR